VVDHVRGAELVQQVEFQAGDQLLEPLDDLLVLLGAHNPCLPNP
jgi:hypothetical protein